MVAPLRHRQTKEAETDMFDLQPPRTSRLYTKRASAYATDVRNWRKLTYERSEGIRVLTRSGHQPD